MDDTDRAVAHRDACDLVNRLIVACKDGADAQVASREIIFDVKNRDRLTSLVSRREMFVIELSELVRALGGEARATGSSWGKANTTLQHVRSKLGGNHEGDALGTSARVEATVERIYDDVLRGTLPSYVRVVVARQHAEIDLDRAELRRAWFLH
jgi:uncharacterized protein (TIGR02284 family)